MSELITEIEEMRRMEEEKLFKMAQKIVPNITREDILQPNDFLELDTHPEFRYQEGVVAGIATVAHLMYAK